MVTIFIHRHSGEVEEVCLASGVYIVGRDELAAICIPDEPLRMRHCELTIDGSSVLFRALEEDAGIFLDGRRTVQGEWEPGMILQMGRVLLLREPSTSPALEESSEPPQLPASGLSPFHTLPANGASGGSPWSPSTAVRAQRKSARAVLCGVSKLAFFGTLGAAGAILGSALGECLLPALSESSYPLIISHRKESLAGPSWFSLVIAAVYSALVAASIGMPLLIGQNILSRRKLLQSQEYLRLLLRAVAVAVVGVFAGEFLGRIWPPTSPEDLETHLGRITAWMVFGAMLGPGIGAVVPNLPRVRAAVAGAFGGMASCSIVAILFLSSYPEVVCRILGAGVLGLYIGLMISWVERSAREAALIVHWNDFERTTINLGPEPVLLGSSERAQIFLSADSGFPPEAAAITFRNGEVLLENRIQNTRHTLQNGNTVQLGDVRLEIQTDLRSDRADK